VEDCVSDDLANFDPGDDLRRSGVVTSHVSGPGLQVDRTSSALLTILRTRRVDDAAADVARHPCVELFVALVLELV